MARVMDKYSVSCMVDWMVHWMVILMAQKWVLSRDSMLELLKEA